MGTAAVTALKEGKTGIMVGIVNDEIVYTPLEETVTKKKKINPHYLFTCGILAT